MTLAWVDASAGASGDMLLGALVHAGADLATIQRNVDALDLPETITFGQGATQRAGLRACKVEVKVADSSTSRTWSSIRTLISESALPGEVRDDSLRVFQALAAAEARVHGIDVDQIHFHEVGALDSIADVVGVVTALHDLQISDLRCSPVAVGFGSVVSTHGRMTIPVPAVAELFAATSDAQLIAGWTEHEACTPTAAALLTTLVDTWGPVPAMTVARTGVGAGHRDTEGQANVVRVLLGEPSRVENPNDNLELHCNVDDLDPRIWPFVIERLLEAGAQDAWLEPITMKKQRAAVALKVLVRPDRLGEVGDIVVRETSTIGYRIHHVEKVELKRRFTTVTVDDRPVRVKISEDLTGRVVNLSAEYEDAVAVAVASGMPLAQIMARAVELARSEL